MVLSLPLVSRSYFASDVASLRSDCAVHGQTRAPFRVLVGRGGAALVLVLMDVESDCGACSEENLRAYDELRQYGVANVFHTVEQPGFCSETESGSEESDSERVTVQKAS